MRQLLARRDARIYLTGQLFSLFGDSSLWLAMGIWVKTLTGSNAQAGLVIFFFTAPSLLAPALGLLADRVRRRPLLLTVNTLTAGAVLALLAVEGRGQVWLIDLVMFAYGLSYGVIGPAQSALLTVMLPAELLPDANAALRTAQELVSLIGPLAGAGLFVAVGPHAVVVIDAASFAFPVASLLLLRVREPALNAVAGALGQSTDGRDPAHLAYRRTATRRRRGGMYHRGVRLRRDDQLRHRRQRAAPVARPSSESSPRCRAPVRSRAGSAPPPWSAASVRDA